MTAASIRNIIYDYPRRYKLDLDNTKTEYPAQECAFEAWKRNQENSPYTTDKDLKNPTPTMISCGCPRCKKVRM